MAATFRFAGAIQNPAYRPTGDFIFFYHHAFGAVAAAAAVAAGLC